MRTTLFLLLPIIILIVTPWVVCSYYKQKLKDKDNKIKYLNQVIQDMEQKENETIAWLTEELHGLQYVSDWMELNIDKRED